MVWLFFEDTALFYLRLAFICGQYFGCYGLTKNLKKTGRR